MANTIVVIEHSDGSHRYYELSDAEYLRQLEVEMSSIEISEERYRELRGIRYRFPQASTDG